jgi:hypothetical protein
VTVIRTYPTPADQQDPIPAEVYTYVGVKAGELLSLGKATDDYGTASAILIGLADNGNTYRVTTSCGSGQGNGPLVAITVRSCAPQIGLYVEANNSAFFKRAPYAENIDVSHEPLTQVLTSTISSTNVPAGATVNVEERVVADGFAFYSTGNKQVETNPANVNLPAADGVNQLIRTRVDVDGSTQMIGTLSAYSADSVVVDASQNLITTVTNLDYTRSVFTWTEGAGASPDAVVATIRVTPKAPNDNRPFVRMIIAPHTTPTFTVPSVGGSGAFYNAALDDQINTALGLVTATGGYGALRTHVFNGDSIIDSPPLGGAVTLSYSGNAPGL